MAKAKKSPKAKTPARLVEAHGKKIITTSLLIAEKFGKSHNFVLKKIDRLQCSQEFHRANYAQSFYLAANGKMEKCYNVTEEGFMFVAMSFTGEEAMKWKESFITAFQKMRRVLADPNRAKEIKLKRDAARDMTDTLEFVRETIGKETNNTHFMSEHFFCNRALTGVWAKIVESDLDVYDTRLLLAIRKRNTLLITRYPKQADRKKHLDDFVSDYGYFCPSPRKGKN